MPSVSLFLKNVHNTVHGFDMKRNFSEPKIYTGGADPSQWSRLSRKQQSEALARDWYVYWSYRDPETGKLKRQHNIKAGANRFGTKRDRYAHLRTLQRNLHWLLERGFNPYADNSQLARELSIGGMDGTEPAKKTSILEEVRQHSNNPKHNAETPITPSNPQQPVPILVLDAIKKALALKKRTLSPTSYSRFKSRTNQFSQWTTKNFGAIGVDQLDKKLAIAYLDSVLERTSARTRNNAKTDLSALFQYFEDHGHIPHNYVRGIRAMRTQPNLHKTYTPDQLDQLESCLEVNDPLLLLFIRFISYTFLRPIEVCRLRIVDVDTKNRQITVRTKTKKRSVRILPDILLGHLPDLSGYPPGDHLFTPQGIGGIWDTLEDNKRGYFSKRFKKVKDALGLGREFGLYSYRHTYITKLYRSLREKHTPIIAKGKLMTITGHSTIGALEKYLRDINAEFPDDYSHLFGE